jgi:hypothetical protein
MKARLGERIGIEEAIQDLFGDDDLFGDRTELALKQMSASARFRVTQQHTR